MGSMIACRQWIKALRCQAKAQVGALAVLEKAFVQEARHLHRHDQARRLQALRARVTQEVRRMGRRETDSSFSFNKVTVISGFVGFGFGSLWGLLHRTREHPLSIGAELAERVLARTQPFDTVLVAVGPSGVPDDVNVIPVSQWAREQGRSEADIAAVLEACGYLLMAPQTFLEVLDDLEDRVLRRIIALPVARDSFLVKPADGGSE